MGATDAGRLDLTHVFSKERIYVNVLGRFVNDIPETLPSPLPISSSPS